MKLKDEIKELLKTVKGDLPIKKYLELSKKYNVDTHELAFIWQVARDGDLDRMGGLGRYVTKD